MIDALMVLVILKEEWNNIQIIHDMDQSISVPFTVSLMNLGTCWIFWIPSRA